MTDPIVFLNDKFVAASQAHINIYDLGLVMGATMTEMTRTFTHVPFRLEDHLARLFRSCKYAGITVPFSSVELKEKTQELIATNCELIADHEELSIVHFVTAGEHPMYANGNAVRQSPTVCIHSFKTPLRRWKQLFTDGAHVVTPSIRHLPPQCIDPKTKHRSRFHWFLADQQSRNVDPNALSLLLDLEGNITECAGANFLIIKDQTIYTPKSRNILAGVSLQTVREIAAEQNIDVIEKDLQIYDVVNADEAWLTTTPYCIAPCTKINNIPVGNGMIGPLFYRIMELWSLRVGVDILAQIKNH